MVMDVILVRDFLPENLRGPEATRQTRNGRARLPVGADRLSVRIVIGAKDRSWHPAARSSEQTASWHLKDITSLGAGMQS
jgi:hypothetical protein